MPFVLNALGDLDGAVERHPAHHLAADVLRLVGQLPDAVIRLAPMHLHVLCGAANQIPVCRLPAATVLKIDQRAVGEVAQRIELALLERMVAEAHRQ